MVVVESRGHARPQPREGVPGQAPCRPGDEARGTGDQRKALRWPAGLTMAITRRNLLRSAMTPKSLAARIGLQLGSTPDSSDQQSITGPPPVIPNHEIFGRIGAGSYG